jgi:regulation of enolase protein 1 (concanavalin A-like superfamily)
MVCLISAFFISVTMAALPEPWQGQDIGNVGAIGSSSYSDGVFTISGSGADIWNTSDAFYYVYRSFTGNVQLITQVTSQTYTDGWAKAGLMIRENLSSDSKHAMMIISAGNGSSFQFRASTGGSSNHVTQGDGLQVPCWLRLIRVGNKFKGYSSDDGTNWTLVGTTTISMSSNVYVGLCVTSHHYGLLSTAEFENVSVGVDTTPPSPNPAVWSVEPNAAGSDMITMAATEGTDDNGLVEYYFEETTGNSGGSNSGWSSNPAYTDNGLRPATTYTYVTRMRDASENTTIDSLPVSVTTQPSVDLDGNRFIDVCDISIWTEHWLEVNCPNNLWCGGADLDMNGDVAFPDFGLLADVWLQSYGGLGHFHQWAMTPPMGWNSYDCYGYCVREHQVKANADFMTAYLKQYGWQYVVVDFCWYVPDIGITGVPNQNGSFVPHSSLDEYGRLLPDPDRFPSSVGGAGFKPLADYVHSLGLKFGIHLMRGIPREVVALDLPVKGTAYTASDIADTSSTCSWYNLMYGLDMSHPGAQAYLDSLFELYVSWDVDFVKIDDLSRPYHTSEVEGYRNAIDSCGRQIVLSTSPGATPISAAEHVKEHANMWRLLDDLWDNWSSMNLTFEKAEEWYPYRGPGHWPDLDMLPMGKLSKYGPVGSERYSNLTQDECYTMLSLWCISRSPLMFGGNLPENNAFTTQIITNPETIAVNHNSTGNHPVYSGTYPVWVANVPDSNDDKYLAVFNRSSSGPTAVQVTLSDIGVKRCLVRDLWAHSDIGEYEDFFIPDVNSHGAGLYKLTVLETAP